MKVLFILFIIGFFYNRRIVDLIFFIVAFLLLGACVIVGFHKDQILLEKLSVWCYLFLFLGLLFAIIEYNRETYVKLFKKINTVLEKRLQKKINKRNVKK